MKFLFDSEDLLETGLSIINSNSSEAMLDMYPGLVRLHLRVLSLQEMIRKYSDLSITHTQVGVDDITNASYSKFLAMRHELGESIISNSDMMQARKYLRRGVPPSLRGEMWRLAFGLSSKPLLFEDQTFSQLRAECDRLDLLTDELLLHDAESVADDPRFFVFEVIT